MISIIEQPEPHNFEEDLQWSDDLKQWSFYLNALAHFFPDTLNWQRVLEMLGQREGKDIVLEQPEDTVYRIQIKARRRDWGDFLIEWRHDRSAGGFKPGWMETYTPQNVSYILYTVPPEFLAYLVDFESLYVAWSDGCKETWIELFDLTPSPNPDYVTRNCGVPWCRLEEAGVRFWRFQQESKNK